MGKDVVIFIKGTRSIDGESDTVELMTKGRYYKKGTPQTVKITGNKIDLSADGTGKPTEFILESKESGYLLKNASTEAYITTPDNTNIEESETGTNLTITFNSDGTANIVGISGRCIWYGISQRVFGNYATKNETGYAKVYLYKKHVIKEFSDTLPGAPFTASNVLRIICSRACVST